MINNGHLFQEATTETMENNEEKNYRPIRKDEDEISSIRPYKMTQQTSTGLLRKGGM